MYPSWASPLTFFPPRFIQGSSTPWESFPTLSATSTPFSPSPSSPPSDNSPMSPTMPQPWRPLFSTTSPSTLSAMPSKRLWMSLPMKPFSPASSPARAWPGFSLPASVPPPPSKSGSRGIGRKSIFHGSSGWSPESLPTYPESLVGRWSVVFLTALSTPTRPTTSSETPTTGESNTPRTSISKGSSPLWWGFSPPKGERPRPTGRSASPGRGSPPWRTSPSSASKCSPSSTGTTRSDPSMPCSTAPSPRFSTPVSTKRNFFLSSSHPLWWGFLTRFPDTPPQKRSRGSFASWPFEHPIKGFSP